MYAASKTDYAVGDDTLHLVWEGLPHNLVFFREIEETLQRLGKKQRIVLHVVTALKFRQYAGRLWSRRAETLLRGLRVPVYLYEWNERTCPSILAAADLAVIPVPLDDPFAAGRPENKLLLFWRMGIPAVVSATPAYARAMAGAGLEMACRGRNEWWNVLGQYASDEQARRDAGQLGRAFVEANHGEEQILARWDRLFGSVLA
jgi:hypothetical protein